MGSSTSFSEACTTRSATVAIPRRRSLPFAFGIVTSRTGSGRNTRSLELLAEPLKQSSRLHRANRSWCDPVGSSRTRTLVRPHPLPPDGEERGVMNEVVQIIETAVGFIDRPMVQLALHPAYSQLSRLRVGPRSTRIHK
jgi:hypothetical protein